MNRFGKVRLCAVIFPLFFSAMTVLAAADDPEQEYSLYSTIILSRGKTNFLKSAIVCSVFPKVSIDELLSALPADDNARQKSVRSILRSFKKQFCWSGEPYSTTIDAKLTELCKQTGCSVWDAVGGDESTGLWEATIWMEDLFSLRSRAFLDAAHRKDLNGMKAAFYYVVDATLFHGAASRRADMMEHCLLNAPDTDCYRLTGPSCSVDCTDFFCLHRTAFREYLKMRFVSAHEEGFSMGKLSEVCARLSEEEFQEQATSPGIAHVIKRIFCTYFLRHNISDLFKPTPGSIDPLLAISPVGCQDARVRQLYNIGCSMVERFRTWARDPDTNIDGLLLSAQHCDNPVSLYFGLREAIRNNPSMSHFSKAAVLLDMFRTAYLQQEYNSADYVGMAFLSILKDLKGLGVEVTVPLCPDNQEDGRSLFTAYLMGIDLSGARVIGKPLTGLASLLSDDALIEQLALLREDSRFREWFLACREYLGCFFKYESEGIKRCRHEPEMSRVKDLALVQKLIEAGESTVTIHGTLLQKLLAAPGVLVECRPFRRSAIKFGND